MANPNNAVARLSQSALVHNQLRDRIARHFELEADDPTLADTLEGASEFPDLCIAAMRQAMEIEATASALETMRDNMDARIARMKGSAKTIRQMVAEAMLDAGEKTIRAPDITLSSREGNAGWEIPKEVPGPWQKQKITFVPDNEKIMAECEAGKPPDFVTKKNPKPILTVRTK